MNFCDRHWASISDGSKVVVIYTRESLSLSLLDAILLDDYASIDISSVVMDYERVS